MIKPDDVPESLVYDVYAQMKKCLELDELGTPVSTEQQIADFLNLCIEAGVVSSPSHFIAYPSGMPVMCEPGEPIQIYPGKCSEPHHRHWKGQTE